MNNTEFQKQKARIQRATVLIMNDPMLCHLSGITQCGAIYYAADEHEVTPMGKIAYAGATNGWDVVYNLTMVVAYKDTEVVGLVVHENLHKAYRQIDMWWSKLANKTVANWAVDYVVNADIKRYADKNPGLITVHPDDLYHPKYDRMNTKQVYDDLMRNGPPLPESGGTGSPDNGGTHMEPEAGAGGLTPEKLQAQLAELETALRQGLIMQEFKTRGMEKGTGDRLLESLRPPQLPWPQLLAPWLNDRCSGGDMCTYSRLHKRTSMQGIPTPTRYDEAIYDIVLAIDTSGSVTQAELSRCMSDVKGMLDSVVFKELHVVYWGSSVVRHETYNMDTLADLIKTTKPADGGGTDVGCVARWMTKNNVNPTACVVFTDGYVDNTWNDSPWVCPVFVVLTEQNTTPFPSALLNP